MSDKFEIKDEEMKNVDGGLVLFGIKNEALMSGTTNVSHSEKLATAYSSDK